MKTKQRGVLLSVIAFAIALVFVGSGLLISLPSASASEPVATEQVGLVKMAENYTIGEVNKTTAVGLNLKHPGGGKVSNTNVLKLTTDGEGNLEKVNLGEVDKGNRTRTGENNGLLITSTKSGDEAEGTSVMLGTYNGAFDIDFRVFSKNTYEGVFGNRDTTNYKYSQFTDEYNPYNDLQELTLRFTETKENGRSFDIVLYGAGAPSWSKAISGTAVGYVNSVMAGVKTDKMAVATGISMNDIWGCGVKDADLEAGKHLGVSVASKYDFNGSGTAPHKNTNFYLDKWNTIINDTNAKTVGSFNGTDFATMLLGSSFSNSYYMGSSTFQASTQIYFNPAVASEADSSKTAPVVYSVIRGYGGNQYLRAISVLNNTNMTGEEGALASSDFSGDYTVEAIFSKVTANDTPVTVNGKTEKYDRYANMLIYGINGVKPTAKTLGATFTATEEIKDSYIEGNVTIPSAKFNLDTTAPVTVSLTKEGGVETDITSALTQALTYGKYTVKYSATVSDKTYTHEVPFTVVRTNSIISNLNDVSVSTGSIAPVEKSNGTRQGQFYDGFVDLDGDEDGLLITSVKSGTEANGSSFQIAPTMQGKFDLDFRVFSEHTFEGSNRVWGSQEGEFGRYNHDTNPANDLQKLIIKFTDIDTNRWFNVEFFGSDVYASRAVSVGVKTDNMPVALSLNESGALAANSHYNTNIRSWAFSNSTMNGNTMPNIHFDPGTMEVYVEDVYMQNNYHAKKLLLDLDNPNHTLDGDAYDSWNADETVWYGNQIRTFAGTGEDNIIPSFGKYTVEVIFAEVTDNNRETLQTLINYTDANLNEVDATTKNPKVPAEYTTIKYDRYAKMMLYAINGQKLGAEALVDSVAPTVALKNTVTEYALGASNIDVTPVAFDFFEGEIDYTGEIKVVDIFGNETIVTPVDGKYLISNLGVGSYEVIYSSITDSVLNRSNEIAQLITIYDDIAPEIAFKPDLPTSLSYKDFAVGIDDITAVDNSGSFNFTCTVLDPDGKVVKNDKITKAGVYTIKYSALDGSGNETVITRQITIKDDVKPVVSFVEHSQKFVEGDMVSLPVAVATDEFGGTPVVEYRVFKNGKEVQISSGNRFVAEQGTYTVIAYATDQFGNKSKSVTTTLTVDKAVTVDNNIGWKVTLIVVPVVLAIGVGVMAFFLFRKKKEDGAENKD